MVHAGEVKEKNRVLFRIADLMIEGMTVGLINLQSCLQDLTIELEVDIVDEEVIIEGGQSIPIARGKWKDVNKAYLDYYRGVQ